MKNLLLPKNGRLLLALLVFFVIFGLVFDPTSTIWLALAFAGLFGVYRLMEQKKVSAKKAVRKTARTTKKTTKRRRK